MHGSLAIFRKWHPEFGLEPLVARSLMLQFSRILVPHISQAERELAATIKAIRTQSGKQPWKASGINQLVSDIFKELRNNRLGEEDSGTMTQETRAQ
eukprot:3979357-Lingulodinium_polyedra.AAC.1